MPLIKTEPLSIERLTVKIADLSPRLSGIKLVQLSDFHYDGWRLSRKLLAEAIAVTNREKPDLILLTGDYVTDEPNPIYDLALYLQKLQSPLGIYACLGNHDNYWPLSRKLITESLKGIDIKVLWNEIAYPLGLELPIVGLADFWSREFNPEPVMKQLSPDTPRLVLSHNPDSAKVLQKWRVDLQLSGHTHGGQIVIPGVGPVPGLIREWGQRLPPAIGRHIPYVKNCSYVFKNWQWSQGFHQLGKNQLYVNRGLGSYAPGRLFCPPEVTIIELIS